MEDNRDREEEVAGREASARSIRDIGPEQVDWTHRADCGCKGRKGYECNRETRDTSRLTDQ